MESYINKPKSKAKSTPIPNGDLYVIIGMTNKMKRWRLVPSNSTISPPISKMHSYRLVLALTAETAHDKVPFSLFSFSSKSSYYYR